MDSPGEALRGEQPDHPGWREFRIGERGHFNRHLFDLMLVRLDNPELARVRVFPQDIHRNLYGAVHGGVILSLIDMAIFSGTTLMRGEDFTGAVSVDIDTQFVGPGDRSRPLDALVEVVRETGRLLFCRGMVVQEEDKVAAYSAIMRKVTPR